ncbi:MAG TPA: hypothetical protein VMB25_13595 [Bryobacteraceae bacterium]|nr:hypothetical protein [Bryobacteraceae bacterium]
MIALLSIASAVSLGTLLVCSADPVPHRGPRWAAMLLRAALGAGAGVGITSIVFLFLDLSGVAGPLTIFGSDAILLVAAVLAQRATWAARKQEAPAEEPSARLRWNWMLALAFGLVALIAGGRMIQIAQALPVGQWDAWAIWNLRAKFLAGPGDAWRAAVSPLLDRTHPDYPLLLSSFVARAWKAAGAMDALAPIATALIFFCATMALLVGAVALLRGAASALLAGLVAFSTTPLLVWSIAQYADVPTAFYCLGAIALIFLDVTQASRWPLLWAGFCAGLAAWTKNEGVAFLAWLLIVYLGVMAWRQGLGRAWLRWRLLLAGAAPGILITLWFKLFLAPPADPLVRQGLSGAARLLQVERYSAVAVEFVRQLVDLGAGAGHPLILLAILLAALRWQWEECDRRPLLIGAAVLILMLLSDCAIILITPADLQFELAAVGRLLVQIWPIALLLFFVILRKAGDGTPLPAPVPTKARAAGRKRALRR